MKQISLEELLSAYSSHVSVYQEQYRKIIDLIEQNKIRPVIASGTNGKKPALYQRYWLIEEQKNYDDLLEELKYQITPLISVDFYLKHLEAYEEDRNWVLLLNDYLKYNRDKLEYLESVNERSFEIWNREKFLTKEQGKKILKRCGLDFASLRVYGTTEPLAYYSHTRTVPQKILILENKDTFYSMRRHLLNGNREILGEVIGTLIYGAGKGILKSFQDFDLCVEPYMKAAENEILYFGDLDYEGIGIYEKLAELFQERWKIRVFTAAYIAMLEKAAERTTDNTAEKMRSRTVCRQRNFCVLPTTKEGQLRCDGSLFFSYFDKLQVQSMKEILEAGKYIPQEILNISDL